jgi:hypothetical protein
MVFSGGDFSPDLSLKDVFAFIALQDRAVPGVHFPLTPFCRDINRHQPAKA